MPKPKSVLAFENRRQLDQQIATQRVTSSFFPEDDAPKDAAGIFSREAEIIKDSAEFQRLAGLSMISPSLAPLFQTRATHSEYVAKVAESIAEEMKLGAASKALTRSIALIHDIGHPPYSHEGEAALKSKLAEVGLQFDHEQAGVELLLGNRSGKFTLSAATLEGVAKRYNHGVQGPYRQFLEGIQKKLAISDPNASLHLDKQNHIEGQIAATADWIAATVTDVRDMMHYYLDAKNPAQATKKFFGDFCEAFPLGKDIADTLKGDLAKNLGAMDAEKRRDWAERYRMSTGGRVPLMIDKFCARLEKTLIEDVVKNAARTIDQYKKGGYFKYADDVRDLPMIATPSPEMARQLAGLKVFYQHSVYPKILKDHLNTEALVGQVFDGLVQGHGAKGADQPMRMKDGWGTQYDQIQAAARDGKMDEATRKRETYKLVATYIASTMTDENARWHCNAYFPATYEKLAEQAKEAPRPVISPLVGR